MIVALALCLAVAFGILVSDEAKNAGVRKEKILADARQDLRVQREEQMLLNRLRRNR
jgi:hypothetical protein